MRSIMFIAASLFSWSGMFCLALPHNLGVAEPLQLGPVSYFEDRCSRCHGPQGSFYGDEFGKGLSDEALHKIVSDMCRVQGDMPLSGQNLEAQIAYHRSLIAKAPFLAITTPKTQGVLNGETSPKTNVTILDGKRQIVAVVKDGTWTCKVPAGFKPKSIIASKGSVTTTLDLKKAAYSHTEPIPKG